MSGMGRRAWLVAMLLGAGCLSSTAEAGITYKEAIGAPGSAGGQISLPAGLAVDDSTGSVYVADRGNHRIERFTAAGAFSAAWGYDVVQGGDGNKASVAEVSEVRVRATSGTFSLVFKNARTPDLDFDAGAAEVQSALNALTPVNEGGGAVTVTGGPGDATGSSPYVVTFGGSPSAPIFRTNVDLDIDTTGLGLGQGTQLTCRGGPFSAQGLSYQWLANGAPIAGATSSTLTLTGAESGKAIQCQVAATYGLAKTLNSSQPYLLASPAPPLPPLGPASLSAPTGKPVLESLGGNALTCNAGAWTLGAVENFTYRWYRNGEPTGTPTTTAATSDEYVLTPADVSTRAVFQCAVTGANADGASTALSALLFTDVAPTEPAPVKATATVALPDNSISAVLTRTNGGPQLEFCKAGTTAICKAGVAGDGVGQLSAPRSIAVDNSPGGNSAVYVMDDGNPRVQKFSSEGVPILLLGGGVNQTDDTNVCVVASGDACGPGVADPPGGAGENVAEPGAFGGPPGGTNFAELGNELAVDGAGDLYVGDPRGATDLTQPRIQKFDSAGGFLSQVKVPYVFANPSAPVRPISVAGDSTQRLFVSTPGEQAAVEKFMPAEFSTAGDDGQRAGNMFHLSGRPVQLAIDPRNDRLLLSDRNQSTERSICGGPAISGRAIVEYDDEQQRIDCSVPVGAGALPQVTGLAVSPAGLLYVSVGIQNAIKVFELPISVPPTIGTQSVSDITTETAVVHGEINPGFEKTTFRVEYGTQNCEEHPCQTATGGLLRGLEDRDGATAIEGLAPATVYHYRVVAENDLGEDVGPDHTFKTFSLVDLVNDPCPNALARKQTKSVGLLDCRAYELASAEFSGGYDVVSSLVPGQTPFDGYPDASDRLLYGVKDGGIPGTGNSTNRGIDPYLATRTEGGWSTGYVGIPSDNPFALGPFSSTLAGADARLSVLGFGGSEICSPCFADGSSGIPVRLPGGALVQGMSGAIPQPAAVEAGFVAKHFSADGSHLVFGSESRFEPTANEGEPTIYSRDLGAGTTEVVSTLENGEPMTGEVGALDVSADGTRVVVGQRLSTDAEGNALWHPFLHLAGDTHSLDLAPGTVDGSLLAGMTEDAARIFLVTTDRLVPADDSDESADLYETAPDGVGGVVRRLLSEGGTSPVGDQDNCDPVPGPDGDNWNAVGADSPEACGVVAIAAGGGVARGDGTVYLLSPETLDGSGDSDQPNLFAVRPGGNPEFVATLEPGNPLVRNAVSDSEVHRYGDFQVTPDGRYAAFATTEPLEAGYDNAGHYEVYRFTAEANELVCISCSPTESQAVTDSGLPPNGLGLLEDGRVFFNTGEQLTLRDTNGKLDGYEWSPQRGGPGGCVEPGGCQQLISTGNSAHPSGLLGASSDGKDIFFFTRDVLVEGDRNGQAMKIYDAREGGGFFIVPPSPPCAASDECHGPGSPKPAAPPIGTFRGVGGQMPETKRRCKKGKVLRRGRCVKKTRSRKSRSGGKPLATGGTR
jgi:hypothetical protein